MADLRVNFCGVELSNPVITASGTYGFGREFSELYPLSRLGGISCKGTTLHERAGNPPPRIAETPSGILNSVGLQNPGAEHFINEDVPWLRQQGTCIIANIAGSTADDYCAIAEMLNDADVDMVELNISCPNVKQGGLSFGATCDGAAEITRLVRAKCSKPLMVKLSPNVTSITEIARAVESQGADAISLINTLLGMRIDINTRRPILKNNKGGLSGAAVFPVAVRMVQEVSSAVSIPVCGMGGITTWKDAIEMMIAGASCIQVGTACFTDPFAPLKIIDGMNEWLDAQGIASVSEIVGTVNLW